MLHDNDSVTPWAHVAVENGRPRRREYIDAAGPTPRVATAEPVAVDVEKGFWRPFPVHGLGEICEDRHPPKGILICLDVSCEAWCPQPSKAQDALLGRLLRLPAGLGQPQVDRLPPLEDLPCFKSR